MNKKNNQYWYNGQLIIDDNINLSINDGSLLYGATIFTTLRIHEKNLDHPLTHWQEHLSRLKHSLKQFDWVFPNWDKIRAGAEILSVNYPVMRITIFADGRELITGRNLSDRLIENQQTGITAWLAPESLFQRNLPHHKTGNYLGAWLAREKALKMGAKEAILQNNQNQWLETSTGNLWGYSEGFWHTPPLTEGILPGIMRNHLINTLEKQHLPVKITPWTPELIAKLETLAYSNCVVQIIPITKILMDHQELEYNLNQKALAQLWRCYREITS
jgi:4-amino-4-deoxychorismate lyase